MNTSDALQRLNTVMTYAELFLQEASVLKKELEDSGVSTSSAPRGVMSEEERKQFMLSRKRNRMKKAIGKDGSKSNAKSNH